jgi:hypothetical protein
MRALAVVPQQGAVWCSTCVFVVRYDTRIGTHAHAQHGRQMTRGGVKVLRVVAILGPDTVFWAAV